MIKPTARGRMALVAGWMPWGVTFLRVWSPRSSTLDVPSSVLPLTTLGTFTTVGTATLDGWPSSPSGSTRLEETSWTGSTAGSGEDCGRTSWESSMSVGIKLIKGNYCRCWVKILTCFDHLYEVIRAVTFDVAVILVTLQRYHVSTARSELPAFASCNIKQQ